MRGKDKTAAKGGQKDIEDKTHAEGALIGELPKKLSLFNHLDFEIDWTAFRIKFDAF